MASPAKNDKAVMAFVLLLVVCCCCSCSSSALALAGKGTDPAPAPAPGPAPEDEKQLEYITADEQHVINNLYVETGAGKSAEECRTLAYDKNYPAFGHRKASNTCWAIVDGQATKGNVAPLAKHVVGCVTRGEDINEGCVTTKDNVVRGRHIPGVSFENITCNSIESCRTAAKARGSNNFGWREADTGWVVTAPPVNALTTERLANHTMGCVDPTKKFPKEC